MKHKPKMKPPYYLPMFISIGPKINGQEIIGEVPAFIVKKTGPKFEKKRIYKVALHKDERRRLRIVGIHSTVDLKDYPITVQIEPPPSDEGWVDLAPNQQIKFTITGKIPRMSIVTIQALCEVLA